MRETDINNHETDQIGSAPHPYRIGILPAPGFALMCYASTVEPLRAANLLSRKPLYEISHFAATPQSFSSGAATVTTTHQIGETPALDLLLVVAGGDPFAFDDPNTLHWLQDMAKITPRIGGVSGGTVILAKAGLMSGRRCTVHWEHAAELGEAYGDVNIERSLYVMDRDRVTCGGGTAPIDLMHALISSQHGSVFAGLVSDWFLHTDIRAAAAPQRALQSAQLGPASGHVIDAVSAMESHISDPLTLSQLAMITGVSERHLNRLFSTAFGKSTMDYYRQLRLDIGRRLVTGSTMTVADIAEATGFATQSHFSNQYHQHFDIRPTAERKSLATAYP